MLRLTRIYTCRIRTYIGRNSSSSWSVDPWCITTRLILSCQSIDPHACMQLVLVVAKHICTWTIASGSSSSSGQVGSLTHSLDLPTSLYYYSCVCAHTEPRTQTNELGFVRACRWMGCHRGLLLHPSKIRYRFKFLLIIFDYSSYLKY